MDYSRVKALHELKEYKLANLYLKSGWLMLGWYACGDYFPDCHNVLQEPRYVLAWTSETEPIHPDPYSGDKFPF